MAKEAKKAKKVTFDFSETNPNMYFEVSAQEAADLNKV